MGRRTRKYRRKSDGRPGCVCPAVLSCLWCSGAVAQEYDVTFSGWTTNYPSTAQCPDCDDFNTVYTLSRTGSLQGCYWEYYFPDPTLCDESSVRLRIFQPGELNYTNTVDFSNYWAQINWIDNWTLSGDWVWGVDLGSSLPACSVLDGLTLDYLGCYNALLFGGAWQDPGDNETSSALMCSNPASGMSAYVEAA